MLVVSFNPTVFTPINNRRLAGMTVIFPVISALAGPSVFQEAPFSPSLCPLTASSEALGCQAGMPSGLPLVHLHPISVVEPGGMSMLPASVRDRLSPTRKEKLWCKVCLHLHLEQGGMPPVERGCWSLFFFLSLSLTDGS